MSPASGPPRCPITSTIRPIGPRNAPPPRRIGEISIWSSHNAHENPDLSSTTFDEMWGQGFGPAAGLPPGGTHWKAGPQPGRAATHVLLAWPIVTLALLFGFRYRSAYYLLPLIPVLALMAAEVFAQLHRFRGPIL